jgi:cytoskeletal protein CcmA (bactofilin family)
VAHKEDAKPSLRIMGTSVSAGGAYRRVSVMGEATVEGHLHTDTLKVMGEMAVTGNVHAARARVMGTCGVEGTWTGQELALLGDLTVRGDCSLDRFHARGVFIIDGLLSADRVSIHLYGSSRVEEIGGEEIEVRRRRQLAKSAAGHQLRATVIEGDSVVLENTLAKVVRGKNVIVGRGCVIDVVEYQDTFSRRADAVVGECRQL